MTASVSPEAILDTLTLEEKVPYQNSVSEEAIVDVLNCVPRSVYLPEDHSHPQQQYLTRVYHLSR
jgi:hypothetical protein